MSDQPGCNPTGTATTRLPDQCPEALGSDQCLRDATPHRRHQTLVDRDGHWRTERWITP